MALGLTSNDPLPDVDEEPLRLFREYLANNLIFPFTAKQRVKYGTPKPIKVIGIGDPDDTSMIDDEYGILCNAKRNGRSVSIPLCQLDDAEGNPNRQLINDYCCWFHNWR